MAGRARRRDPRRDGPRQPAARRARQGTGRTLRKTVAEADRPRGRARGEGEWPPGKDGVHMDVKAGYKQTDIGVIPVDWGTISLFDACSKIQDGTHFSPRVGGNDYLYITSKNIRFGFLDLSTASRIDAAQHRAIYRRCDVKKGDLLLTKDGANTGNAALNILDEEFSLLSSVALLRFDEKRHLAAYFLQEILTSPGQRQIQDAMAGNAITRLTLEKINKLRFPAPPTKAEEEALAQALSDADALIESLAQLLAKKRHVKQGAMQELLAGKKRLPGFAKSRGQKQTEIGVVPEDWSVTPLGRLVFSVEYGSSAKSSPKGQIPVLRMGNLQGGKIDWRELVFTDNPSEISRYTLLPGDVLFNRTNT